jgi:hypothetical protein
MLARPGSLAWRFRGSLMTSKRRISSARPNSQTILPRSLLPRLGRRPPLRKTANGGAQPAQRDAH